jgi:hypothetical protein
MIYRQPFRHAPAWIVCLCLSLVIFSPRVLAHEGGPRLILQQVRFSPGERIEITGANLGTDLVVRIQLESAGTVVLGEALCDGHGDFIQNFALPSDLPLGDYKVQAVDTSIAGMEVVLASAPIRVTSGSWLSQLIVSLGFQPVSERQATASFIVPSLLTALLLLWLAVSRRRQART